MRTIQQVKLREESSLLAKWFFFQDIGLENSILQKMHRFLSYFGCQCSDSSVVIANPAQVTPEPKLPTVSPPPEEQPDIYNSMTESTGLSGVSGVDVKAEEEAEQLMQQILKSANSKALEASFIQKYMRANWGQTYLIERSWSKQYTLYLKGEGATMRPVDNTPLLKADNTLLGGLIEKVHYYPVSGEVWRLLMHMYGGGPAILLHPQRKSVCSGLKNELYSCYINAGVQLMLAIPQFVQYFGGGLYRAIKHPTKIPHKRFSLETSNMVRAVQDQSDILGFRRLVEQKFSKDEQHDCSEFLRYYLGELQDELNLIGDANHHTLDEYRQFHSSIVDRLFGGMLLNTLECQKCMKTSSRVEPFLDLSIEIYKNSLKASVANYFSNETLEDPIECEQCQSRTPTLRKLSLLESPNYLLITLKRFSNDSSKNTRKVKYAAKLRLTEDMDKQALYSLQAVIVHEGKSSSSGHYYCVARRADKWYEFNDEKVKQRKPEQSLELCAYMLLYQRDN